MDPLSIIVSSIALVQAVSATYETIHDIKGLPKAFDRVNESLRLVELTLVKASHCLAGHSDESLGTAIEPITRRCEKKISVLQGIFNEVATCKNEPRHGRTWAVAAQNYRIVLLKLGKGNKVEALMQEILTDLANLGQYQVFGVATESQVLQLQRDIKELSTVEPSMPDSDLVTPTQRIAGGGTGHQYINYGGNQQLNTGTGRQYMYSAQTMNFVSNTDEAQTKRMSIMQSLQTSPYMSNKDRNPIHVSGTCQWFVGHKLFRQWCDSKQSSMLWVSADPGSGKSVLAKYLVDTVLPREDESSTICHFFFKEDNDGQRSAKSALRCILHQIFTQRKELLTNEIVDRFEYGGGHDGNSLTDIWDIFIKTVSQNLPTVGPMDVVCVLDALDECAIDEQIQLMRILCDFYQKAQEFGTRNSSFTIKTLITSRPESTIRKGLDPLRLSLIHLSGENEEEIQKIKHEIDIVIHANVDELQSCLRLEDTEKEMLLASLQSFDNRTYLWVHLTLHLIKSQFDEDMDLASITSSLPPSVDAAYERMLSRSPDNRKAKRLLHIVVAASRPITVKEMNFALALQPGHKTYDDVKLVPQARFRELIRELCGLLVTIIDSKIYLLHQTVRNFLVWDNATNSDKYLTPPVWKSSLRPQESHRAIAEICVWHLHFTTFQTNPPPFTKHMDGTVLFRIRRQYVDKYVFLDYSAWNWVDHFLASETEEVNDAVMSLVSMNGSAPDRSATWFEVYFSSLQNFIPVGFTSLMVASYCGLEQTVKSLLESLSVDLNAKDDSGLSALSWICNARSDQSDDKWLFEELSKISLQGLASERPQDNAEDYLRKMTLTPAAEERYEAVAQLLINAGADVHTVSNDGRTPLLYAANYGCEAIAQLLITADADVNVAWIVGYTPLREAIAANCEGLVKTLINAGADVNVVDGDGETFLETAISCGHDAIVQLLLDADVNVEVHDTQGRSLLIWSVRAGKGDVLQMLLDAGADANTVDDDGFRLLELAVGRHDSIVQILLKAGANPNALFSEGCSLLWWAVSKRKTESLQMFVDATNVIHDDAYLALGTAIIMEETEAVRILLSIFPEANSYSYEGRPYLCWAVASRSPAIVQMLLNAGADVNAISSDGLKPMSLATHIGDPVIIQMLCSAQ